MLHDAVLAEKAWLRSSGCCAVMCMRLDNPLCCMMHSRVCCAAMELRLLSMGCSCMPCNGWVECKLGLHVWGARRAALGLHAGPHCARQDAISQDAPTSFARRVVFWLSTAAVLLMTSVLLLLETLLWTTHVKLSGSWTPRTL